MITYEISKREIEYIQKKLKGMESEAPKVLSRAVNKTAITARKDIAGEMRTTYAEKSGRMKKSMTIKKASYNNPVAIIESKGKPQAASYFHHSSGGSSGAKLQVRNDSSFRSVVSSNGRKAFVAKMSSGHIGIFQRQEGEYMTKSKRLSSTRMNKQTKHTEMLRQFFSPSSSKMAEMVYGGDDALNEGLKPEVESTLRKNIESQIQYALSRK